VALISYFIFDFIFYLFNISSFIFHFFIFHLSTHDVALYFYFSNFHAVVNVYSYIKVNTALMPSKFLKRKEVRSPSSRLSFPRCYNVQSIPAVPIPASGELAISGKKMAMSPPQGKKNCAKAPPLGKQIGSISPPPGNTIDCLVHVDLHVIILCL
jgi:hypothetical protein